MWLARLSVRQPVLVNMLALLIALVGGATFLDMTREELPEVDDWWAFTRVVFPQAAPEDIEELVLRPIEEQADEVDGAQEVSSIAREGFGEVWIHFDGDAPGLDIDRATGTFSRAVDRAELPDEAHAPDTRKWSYGFPAIQVTVASAPGSSEHARHAVATELEGRLAGVEGVRELEVFGLAERQVRVRVDRARAEALGLPLVQVVDALGAASVNLPAGALPEGEREVLVRTDQRFRTLDDVRSVVLRALPDGRRVTVGDLARVEDTFADPASLAWADGQPAVLLTVIKAEGGDLVSVVEGVKAEVAARQGALPSGVSLALHGDASEPLAVTLGDLYENGAMGLGIILVLLSLFLGVRNAAMAALGLPVALAGGIVAMAALGITINMLSLFSLIIVLGIIVDDAIVVVENCVRYAELGHPMHRAAVLGTAEVALPVVSATFTTISAFVPLLVMTGVMGRFFGIIPKVVAAALVASLIEALFVLPSHLADFGGVAGKRETPWLDVLRDRYARVLTWCLGRPARLVAGAFAVAGLVVALGATTLDRVLFADVDAWAVDVRIELPEGTRLAETGAVLAALEAQARGVVPPAIVKSWVRQAGFATSEAFPRVGSNHGMFRVNLVYGDQRETPSDEIVAALQDLAGRMVGPVATSVGTVEQKPPAGKPVAVEVYHDDPDQLVALHDEVIAALEATPGTRAISSGLEPGKAELRVRVDEERAARVGLSPRDVAGAVRLALDGGVAGTWRDDGDVLDLVVDYAEPGSPADLARLQLPSPAGFVALGSVAELTRERGPSVLRRADGTRRVRVSSDLDASTTSTRVNQALEEHFADVSQRYPGGRLVFGGEYEQTAESFASLFQAFWIALIAIYTILGVQFRSFSQPFVVLGAVPLCFVGVVIGLVVTASPFGMIAGIGVVALAGIVVNDSLVLVDFINGRRRRGVPLLDAIVAGGRERLRPILLTTVTTVAGLLPLGLGWGGENPLLAPMATSVSWGLAFATGLTLIVVPCLYWLVDRAVLRVTGRPTVSAEDDGLEDLEALRADLRPEA